MYFLFKKKQDAHELDILKRLIADNDVVIDIGANIGFYCEYLSNCVGESGKVFAFEPDRLNFNRLKQNTINLKNVSVYNKAVSSQIETLKLYASPLLNVDHRTFPIDDSSESYEVEAVSIDSFVNNSFAVNFIKMDIQGFEYFALKGMEQTIKNNPRLKLLMELSPVAMKKAGITTNMLYNWIQEKELKIYYLQDTKVKMADQQFFDRVESYTSELQFENIILTQQNIV